MYKTLAYLLATILLIPVASKLGGVAHYFANFNYYSTVLCINKSTPELNCHGTCQLTEQFAVENPNQEPQPLPLTLTFDLMPFFAKQHQFSFTHFDFLTKGQMPHYVFAFVDVVVDVPHHPPISLS